MKKFMLKYFHLLGYKYVHLLPVYPVKIFHVLNFHPRRLQMKIFNGKLFPNYSMLSLKVIAIPTVLVDKINHVQRFSMGF